MESGVARAYLAAGDGRMLTVRYVRPGELIGSPFPIIGRRAPLGISAVTTCIILELDIERLREVIETDATAANQVVGALSQRLQDTYATLAAHAFGTMAERVAGHLLDLASSGEPADRLVAHVTQQELAEAVGTAREVVARVLQEFRRDGVVATAAGSIEVLQPERLASRVGRWHFPV